MFGIVVAGVFAIIEGFLLSYNYYHMRGKVKLPLGMLFSSVSAFVIIRDLQLQLSVLSGVSTFIYWDKILLVVAAVIPLIILIPFRKGNSQSLKMIGLITLINLFVYLIHIDVKTSGIQALINMLVIMILTDLSRDREALKIKDINDSLLRAQARYYEDINETDTKIRQIKHDMQNHLIAIEELNRLGDQKKTEEYIETLREQIKNSDTIHRTGNDIADAILNDKIKTAAKQGITIKVEGDLKGLQIDPVDTCTILANLLDNAIEATAKLFGQSVEKIIEVELQKNANFIVITERNKTFNVSVSKSSKSEPNHGYGIKNIKEAVKRNDGEFEISINPTDTSDIYQFVAEIMLPKG